MPSWNDGEESTEEEFVGMDMELCDVDHQANQEENSKLKHDLDSLGTLYSQLVEDVTKLFDWRDAEEQNKQFQNDEDPQKKEMDVYKHMQKLAIDKEKEKLENDKMKE
ncbi:hypothetical protein D1007_12562 [Hordeum vulgare]|nr:hypothetical protein D1007_12562 [Hordeum vulgare]